MKRRKKEIRPRSKNLLALDKHVVRWFNYVRTNLGISIVRPPLIPNVRDFFVIDKREMSDYISFHYQYIDNEVIPIALLQYKPNHSHKEGIGFIDVEFPFFVKDYYFADKKDIKILSPENEKRGKFLSVCRNLNEVGVMISAKVCVQAIEAGVIELPYL
jgi:hypothetical protein